MVTVAHLKCTNCTFEFKLRTHQECWVDEEGNLGILASPNSKVLGEPKGRIQTGFYDNKYCTTCGKVYSILRMDVRPPLVKRVQNNEITILSDVDMTCPQCETLLLDFLGVLELSKHRERAFRVAFNRVVVPERDLLPCPKCKDGKLELLSYTRI